MKKRKLLRIILLFMLVLSQILFPVKKIWAEEIEPTVTYHKTITPMKDTNGSVIPDQYELMLDITSNSGQNITYQPLDIVFVADLSGSMGKAVLGNQRLSRLQALKNALVGNENTSGLIDSVLSNPQNRISLVGFAGRVDNDYARWNNGRVEPREPGDFLRGINSFDDSFIYSDWSNNANQLKRVVSNLQLAPREVKGNEGRGTIGTNTNVEAGLRDAITQLSKARSNAKRVVIVLSDGEANMYYNNKGHSVVKYPNAGNWFNNRLYGNLLNRLRTIVPAVHGFYSVAFAYEGTFDTLNWMRDQVRGLNSNIPSEELFANTEQELIDGLNDITRKIRPLGIRKVTITDTLSKFVTLLPNNASNLRVVKIVNGVETILTSEEARVTTEQNPQGLMSVTAQFADDYRMEDGVRYALKFTVKSSQEALDAITGDKKVTASDALNGDKSKLYSNQSATVTYSYGIGEEKTKTLQYSEVPSFSPSTPLNVPVTVEWKDASGGNNVTATKPNSITLGLTQKNKTGGQDKGNYRQITISQLNRGEIQNVAKGYEYQIAPQELAAFDAKVENIGTIDAPSFKVTYQQKPTLTIQKKLTGEEVRQQKYTVKIELRDSNNRAVSGTYGGLTFKNGVANIELRPNTPVQLAYLPRETQYSVTEDEKYAGHYKIDYSFKQGVLTEDKTVTITNQKYPSLSITNEVSGELANYQQDFEIEIQISGLKNKQIKARKGNKESVVTFVNDRATVNLKRGETIQLEDLPIGASYEVTESARSQRGYTVTYENQRGQLQSDKQVRVINKRVSVPATGLDILSSSNMILIIVGSIGVLSLLLMITSRRRA
ncbi:MAG: VWA domain-containing protein [Granulicatella sp.]|nr:VWA domain-containing protein [Granulicatella sp.]